MILEPLRVCSQRTYLVGLLVVRVVDDAFPGALHAARVHVDLDEAVHRVHVRVAILHPRDVERLAIAVEAGLVKLDERLQRFRERLRRERNRVVEMPDDLPNLTIVETADLVDLFDELAVTLDEARVELVLFLEALEVGHRDVVVQVVGARLEDVLTLAGRFPRHHRLEIGIEEYARVLLDALGYGFAVFEIEPPAADRGDLDRFDHFLAIEIEQELARGQVVVRARVQPEQLGVAGQLRQRLVRDAFREALNLLEHVPDAEVMAMALVVIDVAAGERGLIQMPDERLLPDRQLFEAVGIQLDDRGVIDLLEEVTSIGCYSGRSTF